MHILVIGCGYTGARIAAAHLARGDRVTAATRSKAAVPGAGWLQLDLDNTPSALPVADRIYYTVPPPSRGRTDPRLAGLLAALPAGPVLAYLGTTGVYGDQGDALVDETAALKPATDRARRRLDAENQVRDWSRRTRSPTAILRIAGIYGPGRLPLARLRAGDPQPEPTDTGAGNRIHVDDLVAAALAAGDAVLSTGRSETWNVSDGNPLSVAGFGELVADLAGLPRPRRVPLASPEISEGMRSFLRETRRIDNRKLLALPGFRLRFPEPADGIRDSLKL